VRPGSWYDRTGVQRIIQNGSKGQTGFCYRYFLRSLRRSFSPEESIEGLPFGFAAIYMYDYFGETSAEAGLVESSKLVSVP
jgi:hypothetical protein